MQALRAALSHATASPTGSRTVGEPAWKGRVRALEQQLAESEQRVQQSTLLIAKLRAYLEGPQ